MRAASTGNYYISSWTGNKITRFTSTFTSPTTVVTGLSSPAEIFYNVLTDTLGNCNSGTTNNTTYHYFGSATAIDESEKNKLHLSVFPNPIGKSAEIKYETTVEGNVLIQLYDVTGQIVKTIADENQAAGKHSITLDKSTNSAGNYFLKVNTANGVETKKIVIAE